ncbi:MAG: hypothetical protein IPN71_12305 [Fibrobacteres bacterium]|nr:hypothetical protein [Fibrobacterota bacterium]
MSLSIYNPSIGQIHFKAFYLTPTGFRSWARLLYFAMSKSPGLHPSQCPPARPLPITVQPSIRQIPDRTLTNSVST